MMQEVLKSLLSAKTITTALLLAAVIVLYVVFGHMIKKYRKNHDSSGERTTILRAMMSSVRVLLLAFGILLILQVNGVNISGMMAGLGIASAIVGLALQDYLKDIVMGIHILIDRFFSVGDCVEFEGREAMILTVTLKTTKIGDLDDHSVTTICNRNISQVRRLAQRMDIDVQLSYDEDPKRVAQVLTAIAEQIAATESVNKCEFKGTQAFGESAILYRLRVFCEPKDRADVRRAANGILLNGLNEAGIRIPFNQLDVHMK